MVLRRPLELTQYVAIRYTERLLEAGIEPSAGSVGDSYDNALAETINGLFKTEVIRRRGPWRNMEAVEFATLEWVDWYNNRRLLEPIGNIPPAEERYYAQLEAPALAAWLKLPSLRRSRGGSQPAAAPHKAEAKQASTEQGRGRRLRDVQHHRALLGVRSQLDLVVARAQGERPGAVAGWLAGERAITRPVNRADRDVERIRRETGDHRPTL